MSTAVMTTPLDVAGESIFQNRCSSNGACRTQQSGFDHERLQWQMAANSGTASSTAFYSASRHRNLSGPCSMGSSRPVLDNRTLATPPPGIPSARVDRDGPAPRDKENHQSRDAGRSSFPRKLDRSLSDSQDQINGNGRSGVNSSRYKTELCRPFEESGHCKYGDKCQFAHGAHELRNLTRHPKYKTERCRTYHTVGFCPYGPRCHFIHNELNSATERKNSANAAGARLSSPKFILPPSNSSVLVHRPSNLCGLKSLGSSFESVSASSSPGNLSPSHLDDQFPSIGTFSSSAVNDPTSYTTETPRECDSIRTSPVFNYPPTEAATASTMAPLKVDTQHLYNNMLDMAAIAHFTNVLKISQNQHNNQSSYSTNLNVCPPKHQPNFEPELSDQVGWSTNENTGDVSAFWHPTSTSPVSDDSNGSLEINHTPACLDNMGYLVVNSPHDVGRSMRLPIFNRLSSES